MSINPRMHPQMTPNGDKAQMSAIDNIIDENDARIMGMLGTRDGMRLAFGILWATWGEKNTAASMARHILSAELSSDEMARGIDWARQILCVRKDPKTGIEI